MCYIERAGDTTAKEQIIQYDKIYHHTLKNLGYDGNFGDILKRNPREILNINEVWELHKLRNSLVHELKSRDEKFLLSQAKRYKEVSERFLKKVKK